MVYYMVKVLIRHEMNVIHNMIADKEAKLHAIVTAKEAAIHARIDQFEAGLASDWKWVKDVMQSMAERFERSKVLQWL